MSSNDSDTNNPDTNNPDTTSLGGSDLNTELLSFLQRSPTPFHATSNLSTLLDKSGFIKLDEKSEWQLEKGGRYYFERSQSSLVAFIAGTASALDSGVRVVGAHTDSPCLKIKPSPELLNHSYHQLGIEVYGGALLNPWFDRDLSIAGRVSCLNQQGKLLHRLINFENPVAIIPSLAIHLDRNANEGRAVNPQKQMSPVLFQGDAPLDLRDLLLQTLRRDDGDIDEILDFNLSFYDTQPPAFVGMNSSFIASARLDNLLSCFVGAKAIAGAGDTQTTILICNDHEEVGSRSDIGAQGTMLMDLMERLFPDNQDRQRAIRNSLMFSIDNAHGIHPNYADKHDNNHGPILNRGPVIKFDANQGYATSSDGSAFVRMLARAGGHGGEIPLQNFVMRSDMRCGSTIGPITASEIGIKTVDLGVPTFAMHSIRELAGREDCLYLYKLIERFIANEVISC